MIRRITFATLSALLVLGSAGSANAFFGLLGGDDYGYGHGGCGCEASCGCEEQSCGCEPSCGCESSCGGRRCGLLGGLCGLFNRNNHGCCEASCGCEEASCGVEEASCGCEEPSCGCESSCGGRRCFLLDGLRGLFSRHNHGCGEASCGCEEASCGCEPSCGFNGGYNGGWGY